MISNTKLSIGLGIVLSMGNLMVRGLADTSENQTCYSLDGVVLQDVFRCDNGTTGHSACCNAGQVCWSNGICYGTIQGVEDWLRLGCTDHTWRDPSCFDVCPWRGGAIGVRPCDGITQSNRYCCDDGSTGSGSFACCNNQSLVFNYNNVTTEPTIVATMPIDDVSSTEYLTIESTNFRTRRTSSTSKDGVPTESATGSGNTSTNSSNATGLGVGLGIGLPVAAAILGGVWFTIWRSRRKQSGAVAEIQQNPPGSWLVSSNNTPEPPTSPGARGLSDRANPHELSSDHEPEELAA